MYRFSEHQKQPMPNMASSVPAGQGGYIGLPVRKCLASEAGASGIGVTRPGDRSPKTALATRSPVSSIPAGPGGYIGLPMRKCLASEAGASGIGVTRPCPVPVETPKEPPTKLRASRQLPAPTSARAGRREPRPVPVETPKEPPTKLRASRQLPAPTRARAAGGRRREPRGTRPRPARPTCARATGAKEAMEAHIASHKA
mmetsp:Transcript_174486/g.553895  ORF Transcript_174486/g.553895 Transcript_174486/m.553895 type:complete len:200 (-) Transcript_174486:53-652(-)